MERCPRSIRRIQEGGKRGVRTRRQHDRTHVRRRANQDEHPSGGEGQDALPRREETGGRQRHTPGFERGRGQSSDKTGGDPGSRHECDMGGGDTRAKSCELLSLSFGHGVCYSAGRVQAITGPILSYSSSASAPNLDPIAFKEAALARLRNVAVSFESDAVRSTLAVALAACLSCCQAPA